MNTYITAAAIKAFREKKAYTQAQLAERLGVSDKAISKEDNVLQVCFCGGMILSGKAAKQLSKTMDSCGIITINNKACRFLCLICA